MAVVTAKDDLGMRPGSFGWDGGLGTSCYAEPRTRRACFARRAPTPPAVLRDFWRCVNG